MLADQRGSPGARLRAHRQNAAFGMVRNGNHRHSQRYRAVVRRRIDIFGAGNGAHRSRPANFVDTGRTIFTLDGVKLSEKKRGRGRRSQRPASLPSIQFVVASLWLLRRNSMARARPTGDSKQGLIIALVIFVILSLVLGATTYFGYSEQTTLENQRKDAETKLANAAKEREKFDYERRVYKHAIGIADPKEDDLAPLQAGHRAEFESLSKRLTGVTWNAGDAAPATNYVGAKTKLENDLKNSEAEAKGAKDDLKKAREDHAEALRLNQEELRKTKAALETQAAQFAKLQGEKSKAYEETLTRIKDRDDEIEKLKNQIANTDASNKKAIETLQRQLKDLELQREKLRDQVKPIDWEQLDQPKARIVQIDRTRTTAYVDIGLADRVKAGVTFSVFGRGADGKRSTREPKGSIEIVNPVKDHLSLAKVTEVRNPTRDPILENDLLYNPAWSPNMREHVAI